MQIQSTPRPPRRTKMVFPRELPAIRAAVIVERTDRGKSLTYRVSEAVNNACSTPDCTHVVTEGGAAWCYDNTSKIEVVA